MNKKVRNLIIGAVVLVLLVGALLLLLFLPQKQEETTSSESSSVSSTTVEVYAGDSSAVTSVKVDGAKGVYEVLRTAVEDEKPVYGIEELEGLPQLSNYYSNLVTQFASVTATRLIIENPADLSIYGLKDPQITVEVTYEDGTGHTVYLGDALTTGDGYYLRADDSDTVYSVSNNKYSAANRGALEYVSTEILEEWVAPTDKDGNVTQEAAIINYLEIDGGTLAEYGLYRMEAELDTDESDMTYSSGYRIVSPIEADFRIRADSDGNDQNAVYTEKLSTAFSAERVEDVFPDGEALTAYGFDEPYATIRFARDGVGHVWTIGGETTTNGGVEARYMMADDKPIVYVTAVSMLPWLTADLNNLFSSLMILPHINDVDHVDVTVDGESYSIDITGADDELVASINGTEIDTAIYRKLYQYLLSAPAEQLNVGNSRGKKLAGITYHYRDTKSTETVEFYDAGSRRCIVSLNGDDTYICRITYVEYLASNFKKALAGETPVLDY